MKISQITVLLLLELVEELTDSVLTFNAGVLAVTGNQTVSGNIDVNGNLDVDGHTELDDVNIAGVSTFVGAIDANGGATIDNIQIGITDNNEIDTAAGNLTIDSAGGTTTIDDNVAVTGTFGVSGSTVNIDSADINLGNATSDIITATGRFDSNLVPSTDNARDLGLTSDVGEISTQTY